MTDSSAYSLTVELRNRAHGMTPGVRFPSTRAIAAEYRVSPVTVSRALATLSAEGVLGTRPGSGTFVAERTPIPASSPLDTTWQTVALGDRAIETATLQTYLDNNPRGALTLAAGYLHHSLMPIRALSIAAHRASRRTETWEGPDPRGIAGLREWFASHHGAGFSAGDVIVCNGGQSAISATFRALVPPGATLIVEAPTYPGALAIARAAGIRVSPVPMDGNGVRPDLLAQVLDATGSRAIYLQPTHHNPTGIVMSLERRREILDVAARAGAFLIEDDWARWLGFEGTNPPTLISMDGQGRVIYVSSLTKPAAPSLRVGALVARGPVADRLKAIRMVEDLFVNRLTQETVLELVGAQGWSRHIVEVSRALRERRRVVVDALAEYAPALVLPRLPRGGMHLWVTLSEGADDVMVAEAARRHGVLVGAGRSFFATEPPSSHLRLSFGGAANHDELREAVRRLASALKSAASS
ncbi:MAG TPA: PLP-dependent aminotransferase family protein [Candidatus Limnocylindrales bacterium]|nr:PLP-dependent aminotransferase family protein [Candidatus Limnocylindrales bacterium]